MMADYRQHANSTRFYRASRDSRIDVADPFSCVKDVTYRSRIMRNPMGHDWASDSTRVSGAVNTTSRHVTVVPGSETPSRTTSDFTA
jgi:hypothetical protein